jgi:branched-chain amino acid transport system substrate-binding protein
MMDKKKTGSAGKKGPVMAGRILCVIFAALTLVIIIACKKKESPAGTGTAAASYYIGVYATQTGQGASTGDQQLKGTAVAVNEINAAGGIKGRPLELIVYDDAGSPEGAVRAVNRLIESDKVDVIAGGNLSPNIIATIPYTEPAKVLQVGLGTGPTWTNAGHHYLFRATTNATLPISTFIEKMKELGEKTTAIISLESEYGQSGKRAILDLLAPSGIRVLAEATYQGSETDFTGHISRVMSANPDSIILYGNGYEMSLIMKQLRQQGFNKFVYTGEGGANTDIIQVAGASADGLIFGCAYITPENVESATSDQERAYLEKFVALHKEMPLSDVSYRAYDQIRLIGIALNNSANLADRDANREAFVKINNYLGLAGPFDFTAATGDGLTQSNAYMIEGQRNRLFNAAAMNSWKAAQAR